MRFSRSVLSLSISYALLISNNALYSSENTSQISEIQAAIVEAKEATEAQEYQRANALYKRVLKLDPKQYLPEEEYHDFLVSRAYGAACVNDLEKAQSLLEEIEKLDLSWTQMYRKDLLGAKLTYAKGEVEGALRALLELKEKVPFSHWASTDRTFYLRLAEKMNGRFEQLIERAESAYSSRMYQDALPLYEEIFQGLKGGLYTTENDQLHHEIFLRLAHCQYFLENYDRSLELLTFAHRFDPDSFDLDSLYLLILSCEQTENYGKALGFCREYLLQGPHNDAQQLELVRFQEGKLHYLLGDDAKAKAHLVELLPKLEDSTTEALCRFYIARLFLREKKYAQVENYLHPKHFQFKANDPLRYEWAYLRAEALLAVGEYALAAAGFEEALVADENVPWHAKAQYNLARACLALVQDPLLQTQSRKVNLLKAEKALKSARYHRSEDEDLLALAKVYLLQSQRLKDSSAVVRFKRELGNCQPTSARVALQIGLIHAELAENPREKEEVFKTLEKLQGLAVSDLGQMSFFRGRNLYNLALGGGDRELYKSALEHLEKTFGGLFESEPDYLRPTLKMMALASRESGDVELLSKTLSFFESFTHKFARYTNIESVEEDLLYYRALIASKLMELGVESAYEKGVDALESLLQRSDIKTRDQSLYLLGTLYYGAKEYALARQSFLKLIETSADSKWIGDAWYWAAECIDHEGHDPYIAKEYRRRVFESYPDSSRAAEAYFNYYSLAEYQSGNKEAMEHLEKMDQLFQDSPYLLVALYLRALDMRSDHLDDTGKLITPGDLAESISLFRKADAFFNEKIIQAKFEPSQQRYFAEVYLRIQMAEATALLTRADQSKGAARSLHLEQAIEVYQGVIEKFESKAPFLSSFLDEPYPEFLEEAQFGLALSCIKNFDLASGEANLSQMTERYSESSIEKSYYCSRAWYELGRIAMAKEDYRGALDYFERAQKSRDDRVSPDQIVEMSIQESLCYRSLGQLDQAMLTLSNIINEGLISNLRVKAMYLRAEIYESQGRRELAQRQLEAAAKKGGEWAKMSQDRLIAEYGVN